MLAGTGAVAGAERAGSAGFVAVIKGAVLVVLVAALVALATALVALEATLAADWDSALTRSSVEAFSNCLALKSRTKAEYLGSKSFSSFYLGCPFTTLAR